MRLLTYLCLSEVSIISLKTLFSFLWQTLRQIFNASDVGALSKSQKIRMAIAFDTMWGVMLALKESSKELPLKQNVDNFLGNGTITKTIKLKLRNVSFEGLTVICSTLLLHDLNNVLKCEI